MQIQLIGAGVVCVIGAFVYAISANGKAVELGRLSFACGLLATLFKLGSISVR